MPVPRRVPRATTRRRPPREPPHLSGARSALPVPRRALHARASTASCTPGPTRCRPSAATPTRGSGSGPRTRPVSPPVPPRWRLAAKHWRTGTDEIVRSLMPSRMLSALQRLVPEVTAEDLVPAGSGVRAQAINPDGTLLDDFEIVRTGRCVHVVNAPSPAATASLAIGAWIAREVEARRRLARRAGRGHAGRRLEPGHVLRRIHQGHPRGAPGQPRHRHRQVRRLPLHRLELDAGRERPLGRRHRQPGAAAPRRQASQARGHPPAPVRLRPRALLLGVRGLDRAVHPRARRSRSSRASRSSCTPTSSSRPAGRSRILLVAVGARGLVVPHRGEGGTAAQGRRLLDPLHPPVEAARAAGRAARGLGRADRPGDRSRRGRHVDRHRQRRSGTASAPPASACSSA